MRLGFVAGQAPLITRSIHSAKLLFIQKITAVVVIVDLERNIAGNHGGVCTRLIQYPSKRPLSLRRRSWEMYMLATYSENAQTGVNQIQKQSSFRYPIHLSLCIAKLTVHHWILYLKLQGGHGTSLWSYKFHPSTSVESTDLKAMVVKVLYCMELSKFTDEDRSHAWLHEAKPG